mgnify:FL=1
MQYIIMLLIVIGLAIADYLTGIIKAYCKNDICSSKMRKGGLNKLGEVIIMLTACGLDIGIHALGKYYQAVELSDIAGAVTAVMVFTYITVMEIISIFENYAEINPEAKWALKFIRKLKLFKEGENSDEK